MSSFSLSGSFEELTECLIITKPKIMFNRTWSEGIDFNESIIWGIDETEIPEFEVTRFLENWWFDHFDRVTIEVENFEVFRELFSVCDIGIKTINTLLRWISDIFESDYTCSIITLTLALHSICVTGFVMISTWVNNVEVKFSLTILGEKDNSDVILTFRFSDHGEGNILELFESEMDWINFFFD